MIRSADFVDLYTTEDSLFIPYYNDLLRINKEDFNNWVASNFIELNTITSLSEVAPSSDEIKFFIEKGYVHKSSQCHYTAKAINLIKNDYEYWTGFLTIKSTDNCFASHSFNIIKNEIKDFSKISDEHSLKHDNESLPHTYYGIKIPNDFVEHYRSETFKNESMKPLLYEYYMYTILNH